MYIPVFGKLICRLFPYLHKYSFPRTRIIKDGMVVAEFGICPRCHLKRGPTSVKPYSTVELDCSIKVIFDDTYEENKE